LTGRHPRSGGAAPTALHPQDDFVVSFRVLTVSGAEGAGLRDVQAEAVRQFLTWVRSRQTAAAAGRTAPRLTQD
jgi:hypothetical protein